MLIFTIRTIDSGVAYPVICHAGSIVAEDAWSLTRYEHSWKVRKSKLVATTFWLPHPVSSTPLGQSSVVSQTRSFGMHSPVTHCTPPSRQAKWSKCHGLIWKEAVILDLAFLLLTAIRWFIFSVRTIRCAVTDLTIGNAFSCVAEHTRRRAFCKNQIQITLLCSVSIHSR